MKNLFCSFNGYTKLPLMDEDYVLLNDTSTYTVCEYCGKEFNTKNPKAKCCSNECSHAKLHDDAYKDFLENNEKYCNGGYTPKNFKNDFLKEQNLFGFPSF